jgi:hypothetical protein
MNSTNSFNFSSADELFNFVKEVEHEVEIRKFDKRIEKNSILKEHVELRLRNKLKIKRIRSAISDIKYINYLSMRDKEHDIKDFICIRGLTTRILDFLDDILLEEETSCRNIEKGIKNYHPKGLLKKIDMWVEKQMSQREGS